jgi:hypothetical protein
LELKLPRVLGTRDLPALYSVCGNVLRTSDDSIILDASEVRFIDPHGLAVLGALLGPLEGRRISMPWLDTQFAGYMDRMDFFQHCDIQDVEVPDWNRYDHPDRLLELRCLRSAMDTEEVANRLADAITGRLTRADPNAEIDPNTGRNEYLRFRYPLWYSLSELLENAVTHAKRHGHPRACVWVAAQFYQGNNEVKFSVVDNGCGILRTLRGHPQLPEHTHMAAIRAALRPRVSCNRDTPHDDGHGNQGVGLTTTMRIANAARGRLMIASGNSTVETGEMRGYVLPHDGLWNGVAIAFSCRRHALPAVNVRALLPVEEGNVPTLPITFVD